MHMDLDIRPKNREVLSWIGGVFAAVVIALWTAYTYFSDSVGQNTKQECLKRRIVADHVNAEADVTIGSKVNLEAITAELEARYREKVASFQRGMNTGENKLHKLWGHW